MEESEMTNSANREEKLKLFLSTARIKEELADINPDISFLSLFSGGEEGEQFPNIFTCTNDDIKEFLNLETLQEHQTAYAARVGVWSWLIKNHIDNIGLIKFVINDLKCDVGDIRNYIYNYMVTANSEAKSKIDLKIKQFWTSICSDWFHKDPKHSINHRSFIYGVGKEINSWKETDVILQRAIKNEFVGSFYPIIEIKEPWFFDGTKKGSPCRVEFKIAEAHALYILQEVQGSSFGEELLLESAEELTDLLKMAVDKGNAIGSIGETQDFTTFNREEIQFNKDPMPSSELNPLIDALRDSFRIVWKKDKDLAKLLFSKWSRIKSPVFYKLMMFAAVETEHQPFINACIRMLKNKRNIILWNISTKAQLTNKDVGFLSSLEFTKNQLSTLQKLIMEGPPRSRYKDEVSDDAYEQYKNSDINHRLQRLAKKNYDNLDAKIKGRVDHIKEIEFRDQIMGPIEGGIWQPKKIFDGMDTNGIVDKIMSDDRVSFQKEELEYYAMANPHKALEALRVLKSKGIANFKDYSIRVLYGFRNAVESKQESTTSLKTFEYCKMVLKTFSEELISDMADDDTSYALIHFLEAIPKNTDFDLQRDQEEFFSYWEKYLVSPDNNALMKDPLNNAINSSSGRLASILFNVYFSTKPERNKGINEQYKARLEKMLKSDRIYDKVIIASRAFPLFEIDPEWVQSKIVPLMDWSNRPTLSVAMWCGYFWSPQYSFEFIKCFKEAISNLYKNKAQFDELDNTRDYSKLLGQLLFSLYRYYYPGLFDKDFFVSNIKELDERTLQSLVWFIGNVLVKCEKKEDLWNVTIKPWFQDVLTDINLEVTEGIVRLCCYGSKSLFEDMVQFFAKEGYLKNSGNRIIFIIQYLLEKEELFKKDMHGATLLMLNSVSSSANFVDPITRKRIEGLIENIEQNNKKEDLEKIDAYKSLKLKMENY
jgi:hypothetical protein